MSEARCTRERRLCGASDRRLMLLPSFEEPIAWDTVNFKQYSNMSRTKQVLDSLCELRPFAETLVLDSENVFDTPTFRCQTILIKAKA